MNKHIVLEIFKIQGSNYFYKPREQQRDTNVQGEKFGKASKRYKSKDGRAQKISREKNVKPTTETAESIGAPWTTKLKKVRKIRNY